MAKMTDLEWTLVSVLDALADEARDPLKRTALLYGSHAICRAARSAGGAGDATTSKAVAEVWAAVLADLPPAGGRH